MPWYRRNYVAGGIFFFTVTLEDRESDLLTREIGALRAAVQQARVSRPFGIDGFVVLPEHLHAIWSLPEGDSDYSSRWRDIKTRFTKALGIASPWQKRFWEHTIRDERDFRNHMDYVHFNPVKHGFVAHPADWPYSTFARCVAQGFYPAEWAEKVDFTLPEAGERRPKS